MRLESLKNVNVVVQFSSPLNHMSINQRELVDLFKTGKEELDKHTFIEAPGLKVLIFPNRQKEIIFEATRLLVNDKSGKEVKDSDVVEDLQAIKDKGLIDQTKLIAYGYNFDIIAVPTKEFVISDLVGSKIVNLEGLNMAGVSASFVKRGVTYKFDAKPLTEKTAAEQKFFIHLNAHFSIVAGLPPSAVLREELKSQFGVLKELVENL